MHTGAISAAAQQVIDQFAHLDIAGKQVQCPYFNNRRTGVRGGLRTLIGKGSPSEIEEEVTILALRTKTDLSQLSEDEIKKFLVEQSIGIDCSGFAYYILDAELQDKTGSTLSKTLSFPFTKNIIRKMLTKIRSAENASVKVFAHESNSREISLVDAHAGDMICMIGTGYTGVIDHMLVITDISQSQNGAYIITYAHSLQWPSDGRYNHGVRTGTITITDPTAPLSEQTWLEQGIENNDKNGTYRRAKEATVLSIRRLNTLE